MLGSEQGPGQNSRPSGQGALWVLVVVLVVAIVVAAVLLYYAVARGDSQASSSAPKKTVTATATVTSKVKRSTEEAAPKKERCAKSMFSDNPEQLSVKFCDGQWAVTTGKNTGGYLAWHWNGASWSEYKRHGTQWPSDYACYDTERMKKDGASAGFRNAVAVCEKSAEPTSSTSAAPSSTQPSSTEDRCAPKMFSPSEDTPESGIGSVVVKYCDGQWAYWGVYGVGGLVVSKWNGSGWSDYQRYNESMGEEEACSQVEAARADGMPEQLASQLWTCGD